MIWKSEHYRFWEMVGHGANGCWQWLGKSRSHGYGIFQTKGHPRRKGFLVHRRAYMELVGPIPDGLHLDHLCRNPLCVNPAHLEPVTIKENVLRGIGITAINIKKTHCMRGHEFSFENTYHPPQEPHKRKCKICKVAILRAFRSRQKRATHAAKVSLMTDAVNVTIQEQ